MSVNMAGWWGGNSIKCWGLYSRFRQMDLSRIYSIYMKPFIFIEALLNEGESKSIPNIAFWKMFRFHYKIMMGRNIGENFLVHTKTKIPVISLDFWIFRIMGQSWYAYQIFSMTPMFLHQHTDRNIQISHFDLTWIASLPDWRMDTHCQF